MEDNNYLNKTLNECVRKLSVHYSRLVKYMDNEFKKYNPRNQIALKKRLLEGLPESPMDYETYLTIVGQLIKNHEIQMTMAELDLVLYKLGAVRDGQVSKQYIEPGLLDKVLSIL